MQDKNNVSENEKDEVLEDQKDTTLLWYNQTGGEHATPIPEKYMKEEFYSELPYMWSRDRGRYSKDSHAQLWKRHQNHMYIGQGLKELKR